MRFFSFLVGAVAVVSAGGVLANIDTSGTKLYFEERVGVETRNVNGKDEAYNRVYLTSLQYNSAATGNKITNTFNPLKNKQSDTELKAEPSLSEYAYKIFGVFKDSNNMEAYYQNSETLPISITDAGDLYFTATAGDLDYEYLDGNNGIYPITINAYKKTKFSPVSLAANQHYVGTFSYSSLMDDGMKISVSSEESKKNLSLDAVKNETNTQAQTYKIQGAYKDQDGKSQTYKDGISPPLAINEAGDLYFTDAGGSIGHEKLTMQKGKYEFSITGFSSENIEILGSRTDFILEITPNADGSFTPVLLTSIKGSGSVFTVYLTDNLNEFTLRPKFFPTSLQLVKDILEDGTVENRKIPLSQITLASPSGVVANFSAQFSNEQGLVPDGVQYDITYEIKGSPLESVIFATPVPTPTPLIDPLTSPTPTPIPTPTPLETPCNTENDAQFFYIGRKTGIISFVPDQYLSASCKILKAQKKKFILSEVNFDAKKIVAVQKQNIILADASGTFDASSALDSFSEVYRVEIIIATSTPAPTAAPVISSPASSGGGGGSSGGGMAYIATPTPTPTPTPIVCEKIIYKRYPEQRGNGVASNLFTDSSASHKAYKALIDLGEQKVVNGDQATGNARLHDPISRAEFVKIVTVGRQDTLGTDLCLKSSLFPDVLSSDWFSRFVWNMESRRFVNGYDDGYYRPEKNINLAETYKIISLAFGYITPEKYQAEMQKTKPEWFVPYKKSLEDANVLPTWFANYGMATVITRGDMFALLSNVLKDIDGVL